MAFSLLDSMGVFSAAPDIPEIVMLDIEQLEMAAENFYGVEETENEKRRAKNEELKNSIELYGVLAPVLVKAAGQDKYKIISGHRRCYVSGLLVEEGKEKYRKIPCIIDTGQIKQEHEEMSDEIKNALMKLKLIQSNSTARVINDWERTEQIRQTKEILIALKEAGFKLPGGMRKQLEQITGLSRSEVGRHEKIARNLHEDFRASYQEGKITKHAADELSSMSLEDQKAVYESTGGQVTAKEVQAIRKEEPLLKVQDLPQKKDKKEPEAVESPENRKIHAARLAMAMLEKAIEKCSIEIRCALEQGRNGKEAQERTNIEYFGMLMKTVQADLFTMTGDDMFKESE